MIDVINYERIRAQLLEYDATLVAVSKKKPEEDIRALMDIGQKVFGENYVQELSEKAAVISGAEWHFIGHLQTNKVKQVLPCVTLIQSVDSQRLLMEINKQADVARKKIDCLIQVYIAREESKWGFSYEEAEEMLNGEKPDLLKNVSLRGFMGMATLTADEELIRREFRSLRKLFDRYKSRDFHTLSMGMTSDYKIALEEGSTMVRIGSAIFGERK